MRRITLVSVFRIVVLAITGFFYGCGGGGGGGGVAPTSIGGGGVKGPLANAVVTVYAFDATAPGFKGGVVTTATTDANAQITDLSITSPNPPYIMEFTSVAAAGTTPGTTDLTTGVFPVIPTVRTVITQALLDGGEQIYATPLTTMAVDLSVANADLNTTPWGGDGNGTTTAAEFVAALPVAASQVLSTVGFGASSSVDIFDTPPLIDDTTTTGPEQQNVAEYRAAVEALTAVVFQMEQQSSGATADEVLSELAADLSDGAIDGSSDGGATQSTVLTTNTLQVLQQDPATLPIPNDPLNQTVGDVEAIITSETANTGNSGTPVLGAQITVVTAPVETNPDTDGDGVNNVDDAFPDDSSETLDTDNDGIGNNTDTDDDGDGVLDTVDAFPLNAAETTDTDNDGIGNNADTNDDGDSAPDATDDFPLDSTRSSATDQDGDGWPVGQDPDDSVATGATNPGITFVDTDNDGLADSGGLTPDADDDNDGVPDTSDAFPLNAGEHTDTDGDGIGNNADTDDDGDGLSDTSEDAAAADTDGDGIPNRLDIDSDGDGYLDSIDVAPYDSTQTVNFVPVANNAAATTNEDTVLNGDVSSAISDANSDTVTVTKVSDPSNGTVVMNANGTYTYTPAADFNGTDSFTFKATEDATSDAFVSNIATVVVTVTAVNDAPVGVDDTGTTVEDTALTGLTLAANDTDIDSTTLTVSVVDATSANNGAVTLLTDGTVTYTPAANFNGSDTFEYTVSDGAATAKATVTITVTAANDGPSAVGDAISTNEDTASAAFDPAVNDTDIDSTVLVTSAVDATSANGGSVVLNSGMVTYTPASNFNGTDTFGYTVSDGVLTATGTVTVTVVAVNDNPVAIDDVAGTQPDATISIAVLANDTDVEGDTLSISAVGSVTGTSGGSASINGTSISYTAGATAGSDTFTYTVADGNGGSATGTVVVTVANNAPPVPGTVGLTVNEDTAGTTANVIAAATDATSPAETITLVSVDATSAKGVIVNNNDGTFTYTPSANANGSDSFNYVITDGTTDVTGTVNVTITPVNDAPTAADDAANAVVSGTAVVVDVLGNDVADIDGDTITISAVSAVTGTAGGSVAITNSGANVTYTPGSATGTATFTYTVSDGTTTATATVTVTVASAPVVNDATGVWKLTTTVTSATDGVSTCDQAVGDVDSAYLTVKHNVPNFTVEAWSQFGDVLTGIIDTNGVATLTGTTSIVEPYLGAPTFDTANVTQSTEIALTVTLPTATSMDGTVTIVDKTDGNTLCTVASSISGIFVYKHSGTEDYDGNYAVEIQEYSNRSEGSGTGITMSNDMDRDSWFNSFTFDATTGVVAYDPEADPGDITSSSFDPLTGYFTINFSTTEKNDNDGNGTIDWSQVETTRATGILLRDPTDINSNVDGAPLVAISFTGSGRGYNGDVDAGGTAQVAEVSNGDGYGKRVVTTGYTRVNTIRNPKGTVTNRTMIGLFHPPLVRASATSKLFIEVTDGTNTLCSVDFANNGVLTGIAGGFTEHSRQPKPAFSSESFTSGSYARAVCDPSSKGIVPIPNGNSFVVRVVDTGADGVIGGTDDTIAYTSNVTALVSTSSYVDGIKRGSIKFNGARSSYTLLGKQNAMGVTDRASSLVRGFFDPSEPVNVTWLSHPEGVTNYMLRSREQGNFVERQVVIPGASATVANLPAGILNPFESYEVRLTARRNEATGARAQAFSSWVSLRPGVRGQFIFELGSTLPATHSSFFLGLTGNDSSVTCTTPGIFASIFTCNSATLSYADNSVTLNMTDTDGTYTGVAGTAFTLKMTFSNAANAAVTSPDSALNGNGVPAVADGTTTARVDQPEFFARTQILSEPGVQRTLFNMTNGPAGLWSSGILKRNDNAVLTSNTTQTSEGLWDNNAVGTSYGKLAVKPIVQPLNDGKVQASRSFVTTHTRAIDGTNSVMSATLYKAILFNAAGEKLLFFANYTAPDASAYRPPSVSANAAVVIDGINCGTTVCNDDTAPVTLTTSQPNMSWPLGSVPATAYWRVTFDDVTALTKQYRTSFMKIGDPGFVSTLGIANWTAATTGMNLPAGTYRVRLIVVDRKNGRNSTIVGVTSRNVSATGVAGDQLFVTVP